VWRLLTVATDEAGAAGGFDLDGRWQLSKGVALRPEPFGALAYDFRTRRLSFLKSRKLVSVVKALATEKTARAACVSAGVEEAEIAAYRQALARLARSGMVIERVTA
jgi:mycofactocin biosynthesis protein MftB